MMAAFTASEFLAPILPVLICLRIFPRNDHSLLSDTMMPVPLEDILFMWVEHGNSGNRISAKWLAAYDLVPRRIYVRTRLGVYMLAQRTFEGFAEALGFPFESAGRSLIVNVRQVKWFNYDRSLLRVGFLSDDGKYIEYVTVALPHSRRIYQALRRFHRSVLPQARRGGPSEGPPKRRVKLTHKLIAYRAQKVTLDEKTQDGPDASE